MFLDTEAAEGGILLPCTWAPDTLKSPTKFLDEAFYLWDVLLVGRFDLRDPYADGPLFKLVLEFVWARGLVAYELTLVTRVVGGKFG